MTLPPWEYLFLPFNSVTFPDLFHPLWVVSLVGWSPGRPLQRPDPAAPPPRALPRPARVAALDGVIIFLMLLVYSLFGVRLHLRRS